MSLISSQCHYFLCHWSLVCVLCQFYWSSVSFLQPPLFFHVASHCLEIDSSWICLLSCYGFLLLWGHDCGFFQTCLNNPVLLVVRTNSNFILHCLYPIIQFWKFIFFLRFVFTKWCLRSVTQECSKPEKLVLYIYQFLPQIALCVRFLYRVL